MSSVVLLPLADPAPLPPGAPVTLADLEREVASRLGPFAALTATGGTADSLVVAGMRSTAPLGGYEGLWLLRRGAVVPDDRVRTVDRLDGPSGSLYVDFPYAATPTAGEPFELHHLHPDLQLRADVLAGLRRCYLPDVVALLPAPEPSDATGAAAVDLTAQAFWLTAPRQVLAVTAAGAAVPAGGRYGRPTAAGWACYASRGRLYLGVPAGVPPDGLTVRAYRDAFGLVDGLDAPAGPLDDDDELAVPVDYAAALGHIEAWRRHRDRLEASAAEGRFAGQNEAAAEATRVASLYASFLFQPQQERGDRIASPWGSGSTSSGLGGSGALAGAVVNINDPYA
jgi:hypothetical protein